MIYTALRINAANLLAAISESTSSGAQLSINIIRIILVSHCIFLLFVTGFCDFVQKFQNSSTMSTSRTLGI